MDEQNLLSVDRIEGDCAVLIDDNRVCITVPLSDLPMGAAEGKMYRKIGEIYTEDPVAERARRARVRALQNRLHSHKK